MAAIGISRRSTAASYARSSSSQALTASISKDRLCDQRYVVLGAGSAGMGITVRLRDTMIIADGISKEEANRKFWLVDKEGLLFEHGQGELVDEARNEFLRPREEGWKEGHISLLDVVKRARPTVLIGCSTAGGAFNQDVIKAMMDGIEEGARPIVLPLSNPSRLAEVKPEDVLRWTQGRALVATGSPFGRVEMAVTGKQVGFE